MVHNLSRTERSAEQPLRDAPVFMSPAHLAVTHTKAPISLCTAVVHTAAARLLLA